MARQDLRELIGPLVNKAALARACGISTQYLHQVLNGEWTPGQAVLAALAKNLKVTQSALKAAIAETRRRAGK